MRYIKPIIGVLLIILALLGGYYWETQGRQNYQQLEIPVTSVDIMKGEKLCPQMLKTLYIDKDSIVSGALMEKDIHQFVDSQATQFIPANSQTTLSSICE